ncbi:hypothetical protein [Teredinibacter turnerae]|uniref:hypothetical protein n=1 Tax=Teredinibacter turnerae TaxID=2426 RepID=UPI00036B42D7|nr:hypothetical protein [Teredinibacter turnerae]
MLRSLLIAPLALCSLLIHAEPGRDYDLDDAGLAEINAFQGPNPIPTPLDDAGINNDADVDGVPDEDDDFPQQFAAARDNDKDGAPDSWNLTCDQGCRDASGLIWDAFPHTAAAFLDEDGDGLPDAWTPDCDVHCQEGSGLSLDPFLDDRDNDGLKDGDDPDDDNNGSEDADADSDGLIDIATVEELDAVRYNLKGSGQIITLGAANDTSGCPLGVVYGIEQPLCHGYELTANIELDTNGNGVFDEADGFWNDGTGWLPIGDTLAPFRAHFQGNGFSINNLVIDRDAYPQQGLFGAIQNATITGLALQGDHAKVHGKLQVGMLAGVASYSVVQEVYVAGGVRAQSISKSYAGGLIGYADQVHINAVMAAVSINAASGVCGGLIGKAVSSEIANTLATGAVRGLNPRGSLVGVLSGDESHVSDNLALHTMMKLSLIGRVDEGLLSANHWLSILPEQSDAGYGDTLEVLACPQIAGDANCADGLVYPLWGEARNGDDEPLWDFGSSEQLPGLALHGRVYRDSDGDGVEDASDQFPLNGAAVADSDGDGAPDRWLLECRTDCAASSGLIIDGFPNNPAAYEDTDLDGQPDSWAPECDSTCQASSGLVLDPSPDDRDNDGVNDLLDSDDDGDGLADADADSDGLIDVVNWEELSAIRYSLAGLGQRLSAEAVLNQSGCPVVLVDGIAVRQCRGYELMGELDFDTNGNGEIDTADEGWNDGAGWLPVGDMDNPFTGEFSGNGHRILNLLVFRPFAPSGGLFAYLKNAQIRDLGLEGELTLIHAEQRAGMVAGVARNTVVTRSYGVGEVQSNGIGLEGIAGGLVGQALDSVLLDVFSAAQVQAHGDYAGGLVGYSSGSAFLNTFATGTVVTGNYAGGLVGSLYKSSIAYSYAVTQEVSLPLAGQLVAESSLLYNYWVAPGETNEGASWGLPLATLQCPTSASDETCSNISLYQNWSSDWDFGNPHQLPGLTIGKSVFRDSDGDGILDHDDNDRDADGFDNTDDVFPDDPTETQDTDSDGVGDNSDAFPVDAGEAADSDGDGIGDNSDEFPDDPTESLDSDGDGTGDNSDAFPADPEETTDTDQDGVGDNSDRFPNDPTETSDADSDGVGDNADAFPNDPTEIHDTDLDGVGDNADAFPTDPEEYADYDGDGIGDNQDTDDDNDGVNDEQDPALGPDNGKPVIVGAPDNIVRFSQGRMIEMVLDAVDVVATDLVDVAPTVSATLNGENIVADGVTPFAVPCGENTVEWRATDTAGNISAAYTQIIAVYPSMGFTDTEILSGENNQITLTVALECTSPMYPIDVKLTAQPQSTLSESDYEGPNLPTTLIFDEGELVRELKFTVLGDGQDEDDEALVLRLENASVVLDGEAKSIAVVAEKVSATVTVTDANLPPQITLLITQGSEPTKTVDSAGGEVTVTANVNDPNGDDTHRFDWELLSLGMEIDSTKASFKFDPDELQDGAYSISVTVIDSGEPALSNKADAEIEITSQVTPTDEPSPAPTNEPTPTFEPTPTDSPTPKPGQTPLAQEKSGGGVFGWVWIAMLLGTCWYRRVWMLHRSTGITESSRW